jgi:hypothetical protein
MTAQDIIREIRTGVFTNDDLNAIGQAVTYARGRLAHEVKRDLRPGVRVYFKDRYGHRVTGTVESVKIKKAIVSTAGPYRYNVPINMLEFQ